MEDNTTVPDPQAAIFVAKLIGSLFLLVGLSISVPNLFQAVQDRTVLANGNQTVGTVTSVEIRGSSNSNTAYKTVEFEAKDSNEYVAEGRQSYSKFRNGDSTEFKKSLIGNELTVFYDAEDPSKNVVEGSADTLGGPILSIALFGVVGAGLVFWYPRKIDQTSVITSTSSQESNEK